MRFGEAYIDGRVTVEDGTIYDALAALSSGAEIEGPFGRLATALAPVVRLIQQRNPLRRARRNVAHHYDLSRQLYESFLDKDLQYSCAYFPDPGMDLEAAQEAKKRHIAAKLLLHPGCRVLDIGSGWGGLAIWIARNTGAEVLGVTLSAEQLAAARERAAAAGVADRARFELADYRAVTGRFDRIVSVGMFEHVGAPHHRAFFAKVRDLLAEDGVALLHSIGRTDGPGATNPWLRKHIFPGGYSPALSEVAPAIERAGLWATDVEILRLHYALTLRRWRERFHANRDAVRRLYDERFCRMWEFYLAGAEVSFRFQGQMVLQIQLARRQDATPITRDYMHAAETRFGAAAGMAA